MLRLREYQLRGIEQASKRLAAGVRRVCLVLPTGGGKTVVASEIIRRAVARGRRVLFLAHRRELLDQTLNKLHDAGVHDVGLVLAGERQRYRPHAPVQVASVQTLVRRVMPPAELVFIDEAHHANAGSYEKILANYPGAKVLGLTATPVRDDGRGLVEQFDEALVIATPRELIAEGHLAKPRVFGARERVDLSGVHSRGGDYVPHELEREMMKSRLIGDIVEHWIRLAHDRTTVVFATSVAHSQKIVEAFRAQGVIAEHLDGTTPMDERRAILARLASGATEVVSNCAVLTEGWDLPRCKCVILARPTQSLSLYLQMAGRGLRPWEGIDPMLLDHGECVDRHGFPQDERDWPSYFAGKKRGANDSAPVKDCPSCYAIVPAAQKVCDACGHVFVTEPRDGPVQVDDELVERTSAQERPVDERRAWYAQTLAEGARSLKKLGWCRHRFSERYGHWPAFHELEREYYPREAPPDKLQGVPSWLADQLREVG
ncbi:MAG: DEAD/DEAH box helicase family protein [Myxococcales bacterium]|nr:DEAD/DEAH box helicase family protein [Myxococcales bacterium]